MKGCGKSPGSVGSPSFSASTENCVSACLASFPSPALGYPICCLEKVKLSVRVGRRSCLKIRSGFWQILKIEAATLGLQLSSSRLEMLVSGPCWCRSLIDTLCIYLICGGLILQICLEYPLNCEHSLPGLHPQETCRRGWWKRQEGGQSSIGTLYSGNVVDGKTLRMGNSGAHTGWISRGRDTWVP